MRILYFALGALLVTAAPALAQKSKSAGTSLPKPATTGQTSSKPAPHAPETAADAAWKKYADDMLGRVFLHMPDIAMGAGSHDYDSVLVVPSAGERDKLVTFIKEEVARLDAYNTQGLSPKSAMDIAILHNEFDQGLFYLNEYRSWAWNPSEYNVTGAFAEILANPKIPRKKKMHDLAVRLRKVPLYYKMAAQQIENPTREHTDLAVAQIKGGMKIFEAELRDSLRKSGLSPAIVSRAVNDCILAGLACQEYIDQLQARTDIGKTSFRLGSNLYEKKFSYAIQTGVTAQEAYQAALARKAMLHGKMHAYALQLAPKYGVKPEEFKDTLALIQQVIEKVSLKHCRPDSFQEAIRNQIPKLAAYVRYKNLLYLDPSKPLVVRKEPDYMAGVAGASISSPGPLEKNGNTYYNVGSLAGMSPQEQESYLREYNSYTLQILNIHEAIPGHYTQLVYANQSPSLVKSIFGNGAMIEGWAVYTELMMLENGYGGNSPEMWLMYYKWNLRTVCNTILDYSVHTKDMQEEAAMDLLRRQAFQTEQEAKGKWRRATLTSVQLCSYFTGFDAILRLREQVQRREGAGFNLKAFNEKFLSYGSAPVRLIAGQMVGKE